MKQDAANSCLVCQNKPYLESKELMGHYVYFMFCAGCGSATEVKPSAHQAFITWNRENSK